MRWKYFLCITVPLWREFTGDWWPVMHILDVSLDVNPNKLLVKQLCCSYLNVMMLILMGQCKKDVTPWLTCRGYVFLALTHFYVFFDVSPNKLLDKQSCCSDLNVMMLILMGQCKKDVTPWLTCRGYVFLALTHFYVFFDVSPNKLLDKQSCCSDLNVMMLILMGQCKKDVTPWLTCRGYVFLALTHQSDMTDVNICCISSVPGASFLLMKLNQLIGPLGALNKILVKWFAG